MRPDDNIHLPRFQIFQNPLNIGTLFHPTDILDPARHPLQTFLESIIMLISQNRRRHQHGHLFTISHRLECRTNSDFRFSESHIPANQTIHHVRTLHVRFHRLDRLHLIRRFLVHKGCLHLVLQETIFRERISLLPPALGIQSY